MKANKTLIIAEAGVNHNGDLKKAKDLIQVAADSGADIVKFQTIIAENLVTHNSPLANYQKKEKASTGNQFQLLKELELSQQDFKELFDLSNKLKIEFLSTAFDISSLEFLVNLGVKRIKIPSGEITNFPYLKKAGSFGLPIIISTGMSTMDEITSALDVLLSEGVQKSHLTVLQCTSAYPTTFESVNLLAMRTMKEKFNTDIGYSDHTVGIEVAVAAVSLGAKVIEKHFTLSRKLNGPDHQASLEPKELKEMVKSIRNIELALGSKNKTPTKIEVENINIARRSIVAKIDIKKGEKFSIENLDTKRPGTGLSPMKWNEIIGKTSPRDFTKDDLIIL